MTALQIVEEVDLDLTRLLRPGDTVLWAQATGEPVALTSRLLDQHQSLGTVRCFIGLSMDDAPRAEPHDGVSYLSYCGNGTNRRFAAAGALEVLPSHYSHLPGLFRSGRLPIDAVFLLLPPADADGTYSMGLADEYVSAALDHARVVLAEVNEHVPRTNSGRRVHPDELDVVVHTSRPLLELPRATPSSAERAIARHVAGLVPDGATLQFGLGSLPTAILEELADHRALGVHSGMIGDPVAELMQSGTITNEHKPCDRGVTVAGLLMGSRSLFGFADQNPAIRVRDTAYTHDPEVLASLPSFVALNSAVQVDLTGQVNAEVVNGTYLGAVGGAVDFLRGAHRSPGGLPLIVLPSTAKQHSRIVARLQGPVSTGRSDVGLVVTEHGIADLRGLTLSQRVEAMLAIADPDHRQHLSEDAEHLLSTGGL